MKPSWKGGWTRPEQTGARPTDMTILELYERVNLKRPLEQRRFFDYFNDTAGELLGLYSKFVLREDGDYTPVKSLTEENPVRPLYHEAMADNILFLAGEDSTYKGEFVRKAEAAQLRYWNGDIKGRRVKRDFF